MVESGHLNRNSSPVKDVLKTATSVCRTFVVCVKSCLLSGVFLLHDESKHLAVALFSISVFHLFFVLFFVAVHHGLLISCKILI